MSAIFYTILFFLSIFNIYLVTLHSKIFKIREWWEGFGKITKRSPTKSDYRKPQDFLLIYFWSVVTIFSYSFLIIGLLSSNWFLFFILIFITFMLLLIIKNSKKFGIIHKITDFIVTNVISIAYLIISLNYFHFGYNLSDLILSFFR